MLEERFVIHRDEGGVESGRYLLLDTEGGQPTEIGQLDYANRGSGETHARNFFHTEVADEYSGQGLAARLVQRGIDDAISEGYEIIPTCSYVALWLKKHPEYDKHVTS